MSLFVNFFKALLGSNGSISSRRFSGLEILQLIIVMVVGDQFFGYDLDMAVLTVLISFVLICYGLTTYSQAKGMNVKENVASEVIESEKPNANQVAKDIIQADKPA